MRRLAFLALLAPLTAAAQDRPLTGYAPQTAQQQRALEADALTRPTAEAARAHVRAMTREAHVAGTPAQERTRDYVIAQMKQWGLDTEVRSYEVWLPHATRVQLWRLGRDTVELSLAEPPVAGDETSALPQYLTVNGYSAEGDVSGELVFVNYGLIEDYAQLDSMGVSVRGKIAVARFGRSFRGIKAREAEKRGAIALLMYTDPADDGYVRGDVYPEGPMRNAHGIQRGSVMNGQGDPSTPGYPSNPGVPRVAGTALNVPRIPVIPIGYANAQRLLEGVRGADVPQAWQGGMPFRYHVGPGPVRARLRVETDAATRGFKTIHNTFGIVRGSEFPDEVIVIGGHRDSWSPGAQDNVSGTTSVLEAARTVAEQLRQGRRPKRTILFATWDAEEWGLVGSTEYVEDDSLRLSRGGVAYLNQDVSATGPRFGGGGSPSLRSVLRDVAKVVPDPNGRGSVYAEWRRNAGALPDSAEPAMGDPGGGSDFAGFYNHLGIPHSDWGFGGPGGVYHSHYDSYDWMRRFGDTSFVYHAAAARVGALMALRLANADVLPYDYVEFARTMRRYLPPLDRAATARGWSDVRFTPLANAIGEMERAAQELDDARGRALARGVPAKATRARANAALRRVERALTRPEGLRTRPWFRTLIYAADEDNGYANVVFPSINEALKRDDRALVEVETRDLAQRFLQAAAALREASAALR